MEVIHIPQLLKAPQRQQSLEIQEFLPGLETLTPVRGNLVVCHRGNFLETCDRCLKQYNHRLALDTSEIIWLDKDLHLQHALPIEREISMDDLSETLSHDGYFAPDTWIFEQLSLLMPLRQLCSQDCQPPAITPTASEPLVDSRWASLESLRNRLLE
jgi:uncharacterized protein